MRLISISLLLLLALCSYSQSLTTRSVKGLSNSSGESWTLDLGIKASGYGNYVRAQIYYQEKTGLLTVVGLDDESDQGYNFTIDPVNQQIIDKHSFYLDKKDYGFFGAISPDGQYLVQQRYEDVVVINLWNKIELTSYKKEGNINGSPFISETDYLIGEQDKNRNKNVVTSEIVHRRLPSNEVIERWSVPPSDLNSFEFQATPNTTVQRAGIDHIAFAHISPWGVPIIAVKNIRDVIIYDFTSKRILNRFRVDNSPLAGNTIRFTMKDYIIAGTDVFELTSGNLISSLKERMPGGNWSTLVESSLNECKCVTLEAQSGKKKDESLGIQCDVLPRVIREEIAYKNWLEACALKQDSIANLASKAIPKFGMNSPDNDWIYLGDQGESGMAKGIGDAIRKDGLRFIKNGLFINGDFVAGKMENVYEVSMEGEFKDMKLNGFGRHITENRAILEGTFVEGKLEGKGESIDPSGLTYVGDFKSGTFEGKGKITRPDGEMYDGEFLAGKPHGSGIYKNGSAVERVEFYEGERIDQAYLIRKENERAEMQRQMEAAEEQKRLEYLRAQEQKKSANKVWGALAMGVGAGLVGSSSGMDAMQSMEFGSAMYQDVLNGGTSNLNTLSNQWRSEYQTKRALYEKKDAGYTQKKQSMIKGSSYFDDNGNYVTYNEDGTKKVYDRNSGTNKSSFSQSSNSNQTSKDINSGQNSMSISNSSPNDCSKCLQFVEIVKTRENSVSKELDYVYLYRNVCNQDIFICWNCQNQNGQRCRTIKAASEETIVAPCGDIGLSIVKVECE